MDNIGTVSNDNSSSIGQKQSTNIVSSHRDSSIAAPNRPDNLQQSSVITDHKQRLVDGIQYMDTSDDGAIQKMFVAADIDEKIRMSTSTNVSVVGSPQARTSTTASSSTSSPTPLLPDANVIMDLEANARQISAKLDQMMRDLRGSLHGMTDLTVECSQCYASAISSTCDNVDSAIKGTYQLLAKAEELNEIMRPVTKLAQHIKDMKRLVDLLEIHMAKSIA